MTLRNVNNNIFSIPMYSYTWFYTNKIWFEITDTSSLHQHLSFINSNMSRTSNLKYLCLKYLIWKYWFEFYLEIMSTLDETTLEIGPPPILPSINKRLDQYLEDPELLPMHNDQPIRIWNRIPQPKRLLFTEIAPLSTTLKVERDPATGNSF